MNGKIPSILLNKDFYKKARNRKWILENGAEAILVLQEVWIASSQEKDCKIRKDECPYLPFPLPIPPEKVAAILESAVTVGLLDQDGDYYFNSQVVEDQANFEHKQQNYKEARKKRESIHPETTENPPRIHPESTHDSPRIIVKSEYEQRTVNSELEGGAGETDWERAFPKLSTTECRQSVANWRSHLRTNHKRHLEEMALHSLLGRYSNDPLGFVADIAWSIENGWKSVNSKPKEQAKSGYSKPPEPGRRAVPDANATKAMLDKLGIPKKVQQKSDESPEAIRDIIAREIAGTL